MTFTFSKGIGQCSGFISNVQKHFQKQRIVTSSWIETFLGRQHPGRWPRQLHCFSRGRVSGQSEVMQNLEIKTSEQNNDGNECSVLRGWFPRSFFSSLPVLSFHSPPSHSLFFHYSSLFPSLSPLTSLSSPCLFAFTVLVSCSDTLMWPATGKTLWGHISCRKSGWISRQAGSKCYFFYTTKRTGSILQRQ